MQNADFPEEILNMTIKEALDAGFVIIRKNAKITAKEVIKIRELYATGEYLQAKLASMYGVSVATISHIVNRRRWNHV